MFELKSVSIYPVTIGILTYWILVSVISVLIMRKRGLHSVDGMTARRGDALVSGMLKGQGLTWGCIVVAFYFDDPILEAFGFRPETPLALALGAGAVAYAVFISIYEQTVKAIGKLEQATVAAYLTHRIIWPRRRPGRQKLLLVLLLNPGSEELLFRGFLVFYLGNLTGLLGVFLLLGLGACLAVHCYQDLRLLPFHSAVYAVTIGLLFSPLGLVGCIGFHLAADLYPMTQLKKQLAVWKKNERARRERERALMV